MTTRRWLGPGIVAATVVVLAATWAFRTWSSAAEGGGGWSSAETVAMAPVEARPYLPTATLVGTLTAIEAVSLRTEAGGRLVQVGFTSGEHVRAGAVLARIDTAVEQAELESAQAAQRALDLRRERLSQLAEARGAAQMERDQAIADADANAARIQALLARIRQKTVVAPFDGIAGLRNHHPGQVVDPGTLLTSLVRDTDAVFVDVWVPQTMLPSLPLGTDVRVVADGVEATGTVEVIEPQADARRRAAQVRARVDAAPAVWLPGLAVQVHVPTGAAADRVVVPATALQWSPAGPLVYRVVDGEGGGQIVHAVPVRILSDLGDTVVLEDGPIAGDTIVTDGAFKLREGGAVTAGGDDRG